MSESEFVLQQRRNLEMAEQRRRDTEIRRQQQRIDERHHRENLQALAQASKTQLRQRRDVKQAQVTYKNATNEFVEPIQRPVIQDKHSGRIYRWFRMMVISITLAAIAVLGLAYFAAKQPSTTSLEHLTEATIDTGPAESANKTSSAANPPHMPVKIKVYPKCSAKITDNCQQD